MVRRRKTLTLVAVFALGSAAAVPAGELEDIRDTQKKILERLDSQDKILKDIQQRLTAGVGGRPQVDPNKIYEIPIAHSLERGPKEARVVLAEFSDFQ